MLLQLDIKNVAIIDEISIEFGQGLNVLTGETGAGKSIIIDSIKAVLGDRLSKEMIRAGKDRAIVEAVFSEGDDRLVEMLASYGIEPEEDGTIIVSREFSIQGKNICRVNRRIVTLSALREIGEQLIDIHGQHENQSLLRTSCHILLLDSFGGNNIHNIKAEYATLFYKRKELKDKLRNLAGDKGEREKKIDILKFQIDEINNANLKIGEDEELTKQKLVLSNAEKIKSSLCGSYDAICSRDTGFAGYSSQDGINKALVLLKSILGIDEGLDEIYKSLEEVSFQLEDVLSELRDKKEESDFDPRLLDQIDERCDLIFRLKKKYGNTIENVLEYCKKSEKELEELINSEEMINNLQEDINKVEAQMYILSEKLHQEREKISKALEFKISKILAELEMKNAIFSVNIFFDADKVQDGGYNFNTNGLDRVEFLISTNPGEPLKPLAKIASGGEMSRIMLAIKTILADVDSVPTLIFDEIDVGISGKAASKVGEKLSLISKKHQVLCVTHLAQIACIADRNYFIEKKFDSNQTKTIVKFLEKEDKKLEIARIIGGANISEISIKHAEEMIANAVNWWATRDSNPGPVD